METNNMIGRFCLLVILFFVQNLSFLQAQAVGPTAPEYTSFESFNLENPVQIETGDFTYQIPLLTIPGPEGGFPIALHYHAGIKPDQEASWVGLGWNLNVGAINRYINLFPDDLKGEIDESYTYWEGGQTKVTKTAIQFPQIIPYSAKMEDTFKGTKSFSVSRWHRSSNVNGIKHFKVEYEQILKDLILIGSLSDGMNTDVELQNFANNELISPLKQYLAKSLFDAFGGVGGEQSSQGSSSRSTSSTSVSDRSSSRTFINRSKMFKRAGLGVVGFLSSIEKETTNRYWIEDRSYTAQTGSLNRLTPDTEDYFNVFDASTIPLLSATSDTKDYPSDKNGEIASLGGMLPSFDSYQVLSPGVGGYISPNIFENTNIIAGNFKDKVIYEEINTESKQRPGFRYTGDFSNSFSIDDPDYVGNYGIPTYDTDYNEEFFNDDLKKLASGKHIEWFTNAEINDGTAASKGFITCDAGTDREYLKYGSTVEQKVGGFMITDENGMTYHFSLPVYSYENFQRFEQIDPPKDKKMYKHSYMPAAYAYTWLLTGITGPNYHNTYEENLGTPGLDEMDNGYWVRFDYGLWTTQHKWRTPFEGFQEDVDGEFHYYSRGKKELYYLNKIVTRTHTALFIKEVRKDGKGVSEPYLFEYTDVDNNQRTTGEYNIKGAQYISAGSGGFTDKTTVQWSDNEKEYEVKGAFKPISVLRLKEIVLFKNDRLENLLDDNNILNRNLAAAGEYGNHTTSDPSTYQVFQDNQEVLATDQKEIIYQSLGLQIPLNYHMADEVIDVDDIADFREQFYAASLSSINLEADYSLMEGTPNSMNNDGLYNNYINPSDRENSDIPYGKLSLKGLQYRGRGGDIDMPKMEFGYKEENLPFPGFRMNGVTYTKKDNWGYYHHLFNQAIFKENKPLARIQSIESAELKDAWSLQSIKTTNGAKLIFDYESDTYTQDLLKTNISVPLRNLEKNSEGLVFDFSNSLAYKSLVRNELSITNKYNASLTLNLAFKTYSYQAVCGDGGTAYGIGNNGVIPYFKTHEILLEPSDYSVSAEGQLLISEDALRNELAYYLDDTAVSINYKCSSDDYDLCIPANSCSSCPDEEERCHQLPVGEIVMAHGSLNLSINDDWLAQNPQPGGDIRIKSISVVDEQGNNSNPLLKTVYDYENGLTSYSPYELAYKPAYEVTIENTLPSKAFAKQEESKEKFKKESMGEGFDLMAYGGLMPSPGISYQKVGMKLVNSKDPSKFLTREQYTFTQPAKEKRLKKSESNIRSFTASSTPIAGQPATNNLAGNSAFIKLTNLNSTAGLLKKYETFDKDNQVIFSQINHYLHEEVQDRSDYFSAYDDLIKSLSIPGRLDQQYYTQRRTIQKEDELEFMQMIVTQTEQYPAVLIKQETIDHLYNLSTLVEYDNFDILTGEVRETVTTNSYGETYLQKSIPAYSYSSQSGLGSKFFDISNTNLLSATSRSEQLRVETNSAGEQDIAEVISASETVWSDDVEGNSGIWQPKSTYIWAPSENGAVWETDHELSNQTATDQNWKNVGKMLQSDRHARILESEDINGIKSASRMSKDEKHLLLHANNAGYNEVAFSSAEYFETTGDGHDGGVNRAINSAIITGVAHTGNYSLGAGYLRGAFEYTLQKEAVKVGRQYRVSVWVYMPGFAENELENAVLRLESNGSILQEVHPRKDRKSKEWYLVEAFVTADGINDINISCSNEYVGEGRLIYFDDFRLQPVDATMNCYVYDQTTDDMTHRFDNNHLYINYRYDKQGRLTKVYQEIFYTVDQLLSEQSINYKK